MDNRGIGQYISTIEADFLRRIILHAGINDERIAEVLEDMGGKDFELAYSALARLGLTIHKGWVDQE